MMMKLAYLTEFSSRKMQLTELNALHVTTDSVARNTAPLALGDRGQPGVGTTLADLHFQIAIGIGLTDAVRVGQIGRCRALDPIRSVGGEVEHGHGIPLNQEGIVRTKVEAVLFGDPL